MSIAVSAAPCGYCRQFLYEFEGRDDLIIITPDHEPGGFRSGRLTEYLPWAFGPHDMKNETGLMASSKTRRELVLRETSDDPLVLEALSAASLSYAPYSKNFAGCVIQTSEGQVYAGRYAENAAFNPSLPPIHVAISCMNMGNLIEGQKVIRVVLVEKPSGIEQRGATALLLRTLAPEIGIEYFEAA